MTNTLAYYKHLYITDVKSFITLGQVEVKKEGKAVRRKWISVRMSSLIGEVAYIPYQNLPGSIL
jgi:hypothetical protein